MRDRTICRRDAGSTLERHREVSEGVRHPVKRIVEDVNAAGQTCYRFAGSSGFSTNSTGAWQHTHGPGATVLIAQISQ